MSCWTIAGAALAIALVLLVGCARRGGNPYERASPAIADGFKHLPLPLPSGTRTRVRQGAFGRSSHREPGNEYSWDFEVSYGTPVLAVAGGDILEVYQPSVGGCDPRYADRANNVKLRLADGTVAQYVHVDSLVEVGQRVTAGQVIARTAHNGWICYPHLHFGVYLSERHLYGSPDRRTIPIHFEGVPGGIVREGRTYAVP
jgi:murein DD-endopeptidase MepM/ murein hydrolase activator NlpD